MKLTILGAGSFGSALSDHTARLGIQPLVWCRNSAQAEIINTQHFNPRYLKGYRLNDAVYATTDLEKAMLHSDAIVLALPTQSLRELFQNLQELMRKGIFLNEKNFLSLAKGIEINTGKLPRQIFADFFPKFSYSALSGPSHAEEIIRNLPTAVVIASSLEKDALEWQSLLNSAHLRIYTSTDLIGIELGGAVKNIIAIAVGIARSLNFGDNATAALATRGLAEIMRLGASMGAAPLTFAGLAGAGDLMVTCYSHHSRNLRFGLAIGRGLNLEEASAEIGQVVEGAHTVRALVDYARKNGIELPIAEGVYAVLYEGASIDNILSKLLFRDPKPELHSVKG